MIRTFEDRKASFVMFSPDDKLLALISAGELMVLDSAMASVKWGFTAPEEDLRRHGMKAGGQVAAFSPDGKLLAVGGAEAKVYLLETLTGKVIATQEQYDRINTIAFSPDGKKIIAGSCWDNPGITIWDFDALSSVRLSHAGCIISPLPSTSKIAVGSFLPPWPSLSLVSMDTGEIEQNLVESGDRVYSLSISPNGRVIAANVTERVKLWDIADGIELNLPWQNYQKAGNILQVAFSKMNVLAVLDYDGTVTLWNVAEATLIGSIKNPGTEYVSFSSDGSQIALAGPKVLLTIWSVSGQ